MKNAGTTKRTIGIDVSTHYVRAVQLMHKGQTLYREKVFHAPTRRSTDSIEEILRSLCREHGFDANADIAVALPHHSVFYRDLRITTEYLEQIRQGETTPLENCFPIASAQTIIQLCSERTLEEGQHFVLLAATGHGPLQQRLNLFTKAERTPRLVDTELSAVQAAVTAGYPESQVGKNIIAYLDDTHLGLSIIEDGQPLLIRNTPLQWKSTGENETDELHVAKHIAAEVQLTWQKAYECELNHHCTLYMGCGFVWSENVQQYIEQRTTCSPVFVDPNNGIDYAPGPKPPSDLILAQGLALRLLCPTQVNRLNFWGTEPVTGVDSSRSRRDLLTLASLGAGVVLVWLIGLFIQLGYLEHSYSQANKQIRTAFTEILPAEPMVNPVVQLQQHLDQVRQDYEQLRLMTHGTRNPLSIFQNLATIQSETHPVTITDLLISSDTLRITGSCSTFDQMYQWRQQLTTIPGWERISGEPRRDDSNGQVQFTLIIDTSQES